MAKVAVVQHAGTGRRKQAIARVRLLPGNGRFVINGGRSLEEHFPRKVHQIMVSRPLQVTSTDETYDVFANIIGGGISGQAGALRHGLARALVEANPEFREELKRNGFLTRDPRAKERKKYGLKKARKKPQFSKR